MSLTTEQSDSIENVLEHKLILALPGSGKTHTLMALVERILNAYPGSTVRLVTFTNASTAEMAERVERKLGKRAANVQVSTFASLMLRQFRPLSQGRKLILGGEQLTYIRRAMLNNGMGTDELDYVASKIDHMSRQSFVRPNESPIYKIYTDYQNMLATYKRVDLNGVAREVIAGMKEGAIPPVEEDFILVDEFQDVSTSDFEWVAANIERGKWVTVVGDDDQSIYSWRGAQGYESMVLLQEMYGAVGYLLSRCFRCAPMILAAAKKLIEHNQDRLPKEMRSGRDIPGIVERIAIPKDFVSDWTNGTLEADTIDLGNRKPKKGKPTKEDMQKANDDAAMEKCRFVVERILNDRPFEWAILARTNADLDLMEQALAERRLNAIRLGGKSIFDSEHAAGIVKLLMGAAQPKDPVRLSEGLGWLGEQEDVIQQIYYAAGSVGFGAMTTVSASHWLKATVEIHNMAQSLREDAYSAEQIKARVMQFYAVVQERIDARQDKDSKLQLAVLALVCDIMMKSNGTFMERLQNLYDRINNNTKQKPDHRAPDAVKLATMTGSKGLEFKSVWVINVDEGKIPSKKSTDIASPDDREAAIEEERRLLYVAMTRAEDRLRISYSIKKPSPFLRDIFGDFEDIDPHKE